MAKKKTKTIAKKKSSPKYPWEDRINKDNNRKESSFHAISLNKELYICYIYVVDNEIDYTLECIGPNGCIFSDTFKTLSSAKKFAEREFEKRFNMKNMSFN